jgi:hypothetical protein
MKPFRHGRDGRHGNLTPSAERGESRRGTAAVLAIVAIVVLVGLCGAMLMIAMRSTDERGTWSDRHQALSAAHAAVGHALVELTSDPAVTELGTPGAPLAFGGGTYWATIEHDEATDRYTVDAYATVHGEEEAIEALLSAPGTDIYDHALFAGNSGGDDAYDLSLGGLGVQADQVLGDVYSGGGVAVNGDASVTGDVRATGDITGADGDTGVSQPIPDIASEDYENSADFDVASLFSTATYKSDDAGGSAWQMPESSPAHIFRKNPSDRASNTSATAKDDYFLEDPYEPVRTDSHSDGSDPFMISLSGINGEPGVDGNGKVYYIDGNLWIHNKKVYSFMIEHAASESVQVTFVAKGNIYFSDNIFYQNTETDGIAFIAMKDDGVEDSGNIYFGDPVFGTLEQMHAFMYAENDFIDNNLNAEGSATVAVYGNMTAGNKVDIRRDWGSQHSRLTVNYDGRISNGDLDMPGLPGAGNGDGQGLSLVAWRKIAHP